MSRYLFLKFIFKIIITFFWLSKLVLKLQKPDLSCEWQIKKLNTNPSLLKISFVKMYLLIVYCVMNVTWCVFPTPRL